MRRVISDLTLSLLKKKYPVGTRIKLVKMNDNTGAEKVADVLFAELQKKYPELKI